MERGLREKVDYWAGEVRRGRPLAFVPNYYRDLVAAEVGAGGATMAGAGRPALHGVRVLARVSSFTDPATGVGYWSFRTHRGAVLEPRTAALSEALGGLRMGDLVVDAKAARDILARFEDIEKWVRMAEDARRSNPAEAASSGMAAMIDGYWASYERDRAALEALRAKANKAILLGTFESASDKELQTLDTYHAMAGALQEDALSIGPPKPPPAPRPPPGKPPEEGLGTLAKIGIGLGLTSIAIGGGLLIHNLMRPGP